MIVMLVRLSSILLRLDRVRLHVGSGSMRIRAMTMALTPSWVTAELLLLYLWIVIQIHCVLKGSKTTSATLHGLSKAIILEDCSSCLVTYTVER